MDEIEPRVIVEGPKWLLCQTKKDGIRRVIRNKDRNELNNIYTELSEIEDCWPEWKYKCFINSCAKF
jgi:hypothetical protein